MYPPARELKIPCCSAKLWYKELVRGSKRAPWMYKHDGIIKTVSKKYFWTLCSVHVSFFFMYPPPRELKIPCCSAKWWYKELVHGSKRAPCMYIHDGTIKTLSEKNVWTLCSFHVRLLLMYPPPIELKIPCCAAKWWYKELVRVSTHAPCMYIHNRI